jgi:hypothetical protein
MPARGLFIAAFVLLTAGTASAQYSNSANPGSSSSNAPATGTPAAPASPSADKSSLWGALAFTADGSWATAWLKNSKSEAEGNVAVACAKFGRGECKIVSFSGEYCAALATYIGSHSRRRYKLSFSGGGQSVHEAQKAAMDYCNADRRTRNCQLRTTVCGDGR